MRKETSVRKAILCSVLCLPFQAAGEDWSEPGPRPVSWDLHDLFFLDDRHGWATGEKGVLRTEDGGRQWEMVHDEGGLAIWFRDRLRGLVARSGSLWETRDGGTTWELLKDETPDSPTRLFFHGPDRGWLLASDALLRTEDGGATWNRSELVLPTVQHSPTPLPGISAQTTCCYHFRDLFFANEESGWVVGGFRRYKQSVDSGPPADGHLVFETQNGGQSWQRETGNRSGILDGVFGFPDGSAWVVGSGEHILENREVRGGFTRRHVSRACRRYPADCYTFGYEDTDASDLNLVLNDVFFRDKKTGWAIGHQILATTDAGKSWVVERPLQNEFGDEGVLTPQLTRMARAGTTLVAVGQNGLILNRPLGSDLPKGAVFRQEHPTYVESVSFSPDGSILATGDNDGTIRLWDVTTGQLQRVFIHGQSEWHPDMKALFSPDGSTLAYTLDDGTIVLREVETGTVRATMDHGEGLESIDFSPDGTVLASGGSSGGIRLWDATTGHLDSILGHGQGISVVFSPDGATLAGGEWSDILLWEVETGDLKTRLEGHADEVVSLAFSPDGATLASGSEDGRVRTWDVERGKPKSIFPAGARMPVAISPDGAVLASGSGSWVLLWDLETGRTRATLNGHEGEDRWSVSGVGSLAFSPDGAFLASGGNDGTVVLWDMVFLLGALEPAPPDSIWIESKGREGSDGREYVVIDWTPVENAQSYQVYYWVSLSATRANWEWKPSLSPRRTGLTWGSHSGLVAVATVSEEAGESEKISLRIIPSDFNLDGSVDLEDLFPFTDRFGRDVEEGTDVWCFDLNQDGIVNISDFFLFADDAKRQTEGPHRFNRRLGRFAGASTSTNVRNDPRWKPCGGR